MQRVTSFMLAFLIFASAVVSSIFVIQAIRSEQDGAAIVEPQLQGEVDSTAQDSANQQQIKEENPNMLEGTLLANFTPLTTRVTELKIEDLTVGTGEEATTASTVTAHYTGALIASGVIFQSSKDSGDQFTSPLTNLIEGWQKGIPGMKVGGIRRLSIPAAQAYGSIERPGIPADSDLVFDIELSAVTN